MKKKFFIFFLFCLNYVFAQDATIIIQPAETCDKIFTIVEEMPRFPGKTGALDKFMTENIKHPRESGNYRVYVTFVVTKDGSISDPKIMRGATKELDEEVLRFVNNMPKWIPGRQNGELVCVQYNLPVSFHIK